MMIKRIILISLLLSGCTPPDPPAYACSPRLDGKPSYCPPPDSGPTFPKPKPTPPDGPRGEIDIWNVNQIHQISFCF